MTTILYFIRNDKEYREIIISKDEYENEYEYRIKGMTDSLGKRHTDPDAYIKKILRNGWRKGSYHEWRHLCSGGTLDEHHKRIFALMDKRMAEKYGRDMKEERRHVYETTGSDRYKPGRTE